MIEVLVAILSLLAGLVLGTIFFGGLLWTVRKGVVAKQPALWFLGSLLLRMSVVLVGFAFVSGGHWERLAICLVGFIAARFVVTRTSRFGPEVSHAP
jgi:F1F0 ATPase subunit 2